MVEILLKLLEITESKHENILILKGKYKLPETFSEGVSQYKKMKAWQK